MVEQTFLEYMEELRRRYGVKSIVKEKFQEASLTLLDRALIAHRTLVASGYTDWKPVASIMQEIRETEALLKV